MINEFDLEVELARELAADTGVIHDFVKPPPSVVNSKINSPKPKGFLSLDQEIQYGKRHRFARVRKIKACLKLDTNIELLVSKISILANEQMQLNDIVLYIHNFDMLKEEDIESAPKLWLADNNIDIGAVNILFKKLFNDYSAYSIAKSKNDFEQMEHHANEFSSVAEHLKFSSHFEQEIESNFSIFKSRLKLNEIKFRNIAVNNKVPLKEFLKSDAWLGLDSNKAALNKLITYFRAHSPVYTKETESKIMFEFDNLGVVLDVNFSQYNQAKNLFKEHLAADSEITEVENGLLLRNEGLFTALSKKYLVDSVSMNDLVQSARVGFIEGFRRWDYRKGYKLSTYTTSYINGAILLAREELSDIIKVPDGQKANIKKLYQASENIKQNKFKKPSIQDLSKQLEWSTNKVSKVIEQQASLSNVGSLQFLIGDDAQVQDMVAGSRDITANEEMKNNNNNSYASLVKGLLNKYEKLAIEHRLPESYYTKSDMDVIRESGGITLDVLDKMATSALTRLEVLYNLPKATVQDIAVIKDVIAYAKSEDADLHVSSDFLAKTLNVTVSSVDQLAALINEIGIVDKIKLRDDFDNAPIIKLVESIRKGQSYNADFLQDMGISTNEKITCSINTSFVSDFTLKTKTTYLSELSIAHENMQKTADTLTKKAYRELEVDASIDSSLTTELN